MSEKSGGTIHLESVVKGLSTGELGVLWGLLVTDQPASTLECLHEPARQDLAQAMKAIDRMGSGAKEKVAELLLQWRRPPGLDWPLERIRNSRREFVIDRLQCMPGVRFHALTLLLVEPARLGEVLTQMGLFAYAAMVLRRGPRYMARARQEVGPKFVDRMEAYVALEHELLDSEVDAIAQLYEGICRYFAHVDERLVRVGIYLVLRATLERVPEVPRILAARLRSPVREILIDYHRERGRRHSSFDAEVALRAFAHFPIRDYLDGAYREDR
jgi:hypothetical protein